MTFIDDAKKKIGHVVDAATDEVAAHREKAESDTAADPHVAGTRAAADGSDGEYVGRSSSDVDSDVEQTGAEARSQQAPPS